MEEEVKLTDDEKSMIEKNRSETFRVYHTRTLAMILQMILKKKHKDAVEYIKIEILTMKTIDKDEFKELLDALTLNLMIKSREIKEKGKKYDKNDSSI